MEYVIFQKFLYIVGAFGDTCTLAANDFFGLKPWYAYLEGKEDSFGQCVPVVIGRDADGNITDVFLARVALAAVDSMLRIAALVAVGFVIYGGIQYIISQGEPEKTNNAKNTILNALVGLVIAISAAAIVSFLGGRIN